MRYISKNRRHIFIQGGVVTRGDHFVINRIDIDSSEVESPEPFLYELMSEGSLTLNSIISQDSSNRINSVSQVSTTGVSIVSYNFDILEDDLIIVQINENPSVAANTYNPAAYSDFQRNDRGLAANQVRVETRYVYKDGTVSQSVQDPGSHNLFIYRKIVNPEA